MDNSTPGMPEKLLLYLDDGLNEADKAEIELQLVSDLSLQQELESLQATRNAVKLYGLQQKVGHIHELMMRQLELPVKKISPGRKNIRYAMAIAASLFLVIGGYMAYTFFTLSPDKVFSSNYQSFTMATVRDSNTAETAAEKAYRAGNFTEVVRIHDANEDHTVKGEFLCGAAALELKNNPKAVTCFKEVIEMNKTSVTPILNDEAEYYLSLSYIQSQDYDFALELLNKIKETPGHLYREKVSSKLIRQIKMLKWK